MISIVQHGVKASELMRRRFRAMRARVEPDAMDELQLDEVKTFEAGEGLLEGAWASVRLLVRGVVGEVRLLRDGRRQIVALRLPGDALTRSDCEELVALTRVRLADGAPLMARLADASERNQPLRLAWMAAARIEQTMLRDQIVRLGRMSAFERMAHVLLEVHERLAQVGLVTGDTFHLPLTQEVLSDLAGLSVVHLNRTLQSLRRSGLVSVRQGYVTLLDRAELVEVAGYVSRFPVAWRPTTPAPSATSGALAS